MEDNLIKWQSLWQKQKAKTMQVNETIKRLNTIERKSKTQRNILFIIVGIATITAILRPLEILENKFNLMAFILLFSAIGVKLIPSLKGKFNLITGESELNNRHFINKLKEKMRFNTRYLIIFLFLATLGLNFALLGLYEKGTIFNLDFNSQNRIAIHLSTILILIVGYIVNKRRVHQNQVEISSLLREVENMNQ